MTETIRISPQQAWENLAAFWEPFAFMLVPGASAEAIEAFEKDQNVELHPRTKELISIYSTIGIPTGSGGFCAETAMQTLDTWKRFDNSYLNCRGEDWWPEIFEECNCPSTNMKDYVVIGSDPWGADYGVYMILHQATNTVFGITENIPEIIGLGDMVDWVANHRLEFKNVQEYVTDYNTEWDDPGGAGIAKQHRFYIELGYSQQLERWNTNQDQFIVAFDKISSGIGALE
jgi:hypothetical protein